MEKEEAETSHSPLLQGGRVPYLPRCPFRALAAKILVHQKLRRIGRTGTGGDQIQSGKTRFFGDIIEGGLAWWQIFSVAYIDIHIASDQDMNQAFINAWKKAEQGIQPEGEEHLYFEDAASLLKVLSNQRLILLSTLLRSGHSSIRALSKKLQRNYKNVHADVKTLRSVGLIRLDEQDKIFVPWRKIYTEIDLAA